MYARVLALVSWRSTPTNGTRRPNRRAADASTGASSRQGPHHEPHRLTTTGVPLSCLRRAWNCAGPNCGSWNRPVGRSGAVVALIARGEVRMRGVVFRSGDVPPVQPDARNRTRSAIVHTGANRERITGPMLGRSAHLGWCIETRGSFNIRAG